MAILKNRPLFSACLLYIICMFCARFSSPRVKIGVCIAGALLILLCTLLSLVRKIPKKHALRAVLLLLCVLVAFGGAFLSFDFGQQKYQRLAEPESCILRATVTERTVSDVMTVYRIRVREIDGRAQHFDGQLICSFTSYLQVGDTFEARVAPSTYEQVGSALYDVNSALAQGLRMQFTCESEQQILSVGQGPVPFKVTLSRINESLCSTVLDFCGSKSGGLVCALLLGNKGYLDPVLARDYGRAGASHMLALSGMHVSMLMGALGYLLGKLRMHRKARALLLALSSVAYLLLTGMSVSATRAVAMTCILQLSYLLASDNDTLTTLGLVGAGILLLDPYSTYDPAFILSFLATFGIVVLVPPLHRYLEKRTEAMCKPPHASRKRRLLGAGTAVLEILLVGVIACFSILVPSCYLIGNTSILSPLTTLLLSPVVSALLVLGSLVLLCSPVTPLANIFATLIRLLFALSECYVTRISAIDGVLLPLTQNTVRVLALVFCIGMLVLLMLPLRRKLLLSLPPALLCVSLCVFYPVNAMLQQNSLRAAYTHPTALSESLVTADGYRAYICDLSSGSGTATLYAAYAGSQLHATEIGAILLTDYHTLQGASLTGLFSRYKTDLLYLPHTTDKDELAVQAHLRGIAERMGVKVELYRYGQPLAWFDGTTLRVLRTDLDRSAQPVHVITLERGDATLCVMSAAAEHTELAKDAALAAQNADALVIPERGPKPRLSFSPPIERGIDVVFATRELAAYCDPQSLEGARSMTVCPEIVYFTLETEQDP